MSDIARRSPADLKTSDSDLSVEVREWRNQLQVIWKAVGLSYGQFAYLHGHVDKGTISRYLNGQRVPRDPWFLDKLLALQAEKGQPLTPDAREHLTELHLRALQVAHPHEYRVRLVEDELKIATTGKFEAERYARDLVEQLAERNRQIDELTEAKGRLQVALDEDYERLTREIGEIKDQLRLAQERADHYQRRCQQLEDLHDYLDATGETSATEHPPPPPPSSVRTIMLGIDRDGRILQHDQNALRILPRERDELPGTMLSELTADSAQANSHDVSDWHSYWAITGLLEAIRSDREGSALLTIVTRAGYPAEAVATVHPMNASGTSVVALVQLRIPAPREERFVDPALMRRQMIDDTFPRIGGSLDIDQLGHELMAALVPNFCNAGDLLLLESLADDELPEHEPDGSVPLCRIALLHDRQDPVWEGAFPTGEILRCPARSPYFRCMDTGKPVLETTLSKTQALAISSAWRREPVAMLLSGVSMLILPLTTHGTILGIFACTRQEGFRRFDAYDIEIGMEFASRAAVLINDRWSSPSTA
jgi:hypothetical protein